MSTPLLIRVDASTRIGTGHVMRCLALAQAWQDSGREAHFAAVELPDGLATRVIAEGMTLHWLTAAAGSHEDAAQLVVLARAIGATWIVEDGYHFGADYQVAIKEAGFRLLVVDDFGHADQYVADLILNQNIYADASFYPRQASYTDLLLGVQYVLLRREFWRWRTWQHPISVVAKKILVTMGGSDSDNVTLKVLDSLKFAPCTRCEIVIVLGAGNPHQKALQEAIAQHPWDVRLQRNVADMSELMAWSDLAISASGSVCWELFYMGTPSVLVVTAENQLRSAHSIGELGLARVLGATEKWNSETVTATVEDLMYDQSVRTLMRDRQRDLVDGNGSQRVIAALVSAQ